MNKLEFSEILQALDNQNECLNSDLEICDADRFLIQKLIFRLIEILSENLYAKYSSCIKILLNEFEEELIIFNKSELQKILYAMLVMYNHLLRVIQHSKTYNLSYKDLKIQENSNKEIN